MFCIVFGCKYLGFQNPAFVKELTNMRYAVKSLTQKAVFHLLHSLQRKVSIWVLLNWTLWERMLISFLISRVKKVWNISLLTAQYIGSCKNINDHWHQNKTWCTNLCTFVFNFCLTMFDLKHEICQNGKQVFQSYILISAYFR